MINKVHPSNKTNELCYNLYEFIWISTPLPFMTYHKMLWSPEGKGEDYNDLGWNWDNLND